MWDRITSAFDNFFTGGTAGAIIGAIGGAIYALTTPSAVPGNEIYAMATGGLMYAVIGSVVGAGLGVGSGLLFGSGDKPDEPQTPSPDRARSVEMARTEEKAPEDPSHGLLSALVPGKDKSAGRG